MDKHSGRAVGTVEMFSEPFPAFNRGILRIDLPEAYEVEPYLSELLQLVIARFYALFYMDFIVTKGNLEVEATGTRLRAITAAGFASYDWPDPGRTGYYGRKAD